MARLLPHSKLLNSLNPVVLLTQAHPDQGLRADSSVERLRNHPLVLSNGGFRKGKSISVDSAESVPGLTCPTGKRHNRPLRRSGAVITFCLTPSRRRRLNRTRFVIEAEQRKLPGVSLAAGTRESATGRLAPYHYGEFPFAKGLDRARSLLSICQSRLHCSRCCEDASPAAHLP